MDLKFYCYILEKEFMKNKLWVVFVFNLTMGSQPHSDQFLKSQIQNIALGHINLETYRLPPLLGE